MIYFFIGPTIEDSSRSRISGYDDLIPMIIMVVTVVVVVRDEDG